ncbi:MAG: iron-regulated protein, partial [Flavobacteriales bacterium]|nr:iron-regulated protein [Flavobacteriales bacterium]
MRKLLLFSLLNLYLFANLFGQERSFQIYNEDGKKVSYQIMSKSAVKADVVFFGENHNDPISHWLQLELTKNLFEKHAENLMLGAEMLESDDQIKLDE